ncbi:molybdopterin synthase catalytic subunit [Trichoderma arundinaceum]|uniref:Molybdopterin synthase catalytic subunit n=1 Tax=Trichoderma arundinaceum TaxID=490622 RepID=A0A395NJ43_TRIAR|nr:molybdopterin synthase catalytic subunit [Trichoderma arundinaceum]
MGDIKDDDANIIWEMSEQGCYVGLTHAYLNIQDAIDKVRSPMAGAIVLFAGWYSWNILASALSNQKSIGTTRDNFAGKPVKELQYTAYNKLALRTMMTICKDILSKHGLKGISMIHRLGTVPIGEESILIAVSSPHRQAAWRAGEEALEACKSRVEVWKKEEFEGEEGVWRANRDGAMGQKMDS